jgi:hypothetical protein
LQVNGDPRGFVARYWKPDKQPFHQRRYIFTKDHRTADHRIRAEHDS